jgi:hypothetical protein
VKAIVGRCNYDLHTYSHRQFWRMVRDLTSCGWKVTITAREERRAPWLFPSQPDAYACRVENPGYDCYGGERTANTAWAALKKAVEEIVGPAESGTANATAHVRDRSEAEGT